MYVDAVVVDWPNNQDGSGGLVTKSPASPRTSCQEAVDVAEVLPAVTVVEVTESVTPDRSEVSFGSTKLESLLKGDSVVVMLLVRFSKICENDDETLPSGFEVVLVDKIAFSELEMK